MATSRSAALVPVIGKLDRQLAAPMFIIALLHLMCLAGALHLHEAVAYRTAYLLSLWGLAALTPLFLLEFIAHRLAGSPRAKQDLWVCLIPPLRLGSRDHGSGECVWLPRRGWVRKIGLFAGSGLGTLVVGVC